MTAVTLYLHHITDVVILEVVSEEGLTLGVHMLQRQSPQLLNGQTFAGLMGDVPVTAGLLLHLHAILCQQAVDVHSDGGVGLVIAGGAKQVIGKGLLDVTGNHIAVEQVDLELYLALGLSNGDFVIVIPIAAPAGVPGIIATAALTGTRPVCCHDLHHAQAHDQYQQQREELLTILSYTICHYFVLLFLV